MTADAHVEIEEKYCADESLRMPELLDLPSVTRVGQPAELTLEATYFDTQDLRLAARRVTLRRRTGGDDEGWHLKLPLDDGSRLELHRPLGRSRRANPPVPAALLRQVRARVREAPLAPVAQLATRRIVHRLYGEGDRLLAEVADDQVRAEVIGKESTVTGWRELEVELVNGDRDLLAAVGAVLRAAGARPATSGSKLAHALGDRLPSGLIAQRPDDWPKRSTAGFAILSYLRGQIETLVAADVAVREERHDSVHKMRVCTRRMRSVLVTYHPLFDRSAIEPIRAELKWLAGVLGEVRDVEVMHAYLGTALDDVTDDLLLGPVRARVDNELNTSYRHARAQLLSELDGSRYFRLLDDLDALLIRPPLTAVASAAAATWLPRRVAKEHRRLVARHRAAEVSQPGLVDDADHPLHEVRKAAKRVRYAGEAAVPTVGRRAERFVAAVTELQKALGVHQDTVVLRGVLRRIAGQAFLAGENGFTFGLLHAQEQARADRAERDFHRAWQAAQQRRVTRWLG